MLFDQRQLTAVRPEVEAFRTKGCWMLFQPFLQTDKAQFGNGESFTAIERYSKILCIFAGDRFEYSIVETLDIKVLYHVCESPLYARPVAQKLVGG